MGAIMKILGASKSQWIRGRRGRILLVLLAAIGVAGVTVGTPGEVKAQAWSGVPAAFANGLPPWVEYYGPGDRNDFGDGGWYYAFYDPNSAAGGGIATWFNDATTASVMPGYPNGIPANQGGFYCSLPIATEGLEAVKGTPIPTLPWLTKILVTNPANYQWVTCQLIDIGPALATGAAIDLTSDTATVLGLPANNNLRAFVYYQILPASAQSQ
jgi:hypothetical protein